MNIILVGFMGSGKTTVARILSQRHNMRFLDTDKLIEKKERLTVKEIFDKKGEKYFRELERKVIDNEILFCENCVIATGGGMPCFFDNMEKLKEKGWVVFLNLPFEDILKRVKGNDKRPLFKDQQRAYRLYSERMDCYRRAHFTVDVTNSKEDAVRKIEELVFLR